MPLHVHYDFYNMTEQTKQRNKYWQNHMRISSIAQISCWKRKFYLCSEKQFESYSSGKQLYHIMTQCARSTTHKLLIVFITYMMFP